MANFSTLPPEIIRMVLENLPVSSLLAFGLTSRENHAIQSHTLFSLRLGVFHSKLGGMVSLLEGPSDKHYTHTFQVLLPKARSRSRDMVIRNQNTSIRTIITQFRHSLRDLEISLWELQEPAAKSVALLKNLRCLSIRLDHPYPSLPNVKRSFWETSDGSTAWNSLFAKPNQVPVLGHLQRLNLERAGITDYQLEKILKNNPAIRDLRLQKCLNLTDETFRYLGRSSMGSRLKTLYFTKHWGRKIDNRILEHVTNLVSLDVSKAPRDDFAVIAHGIVSVFLALRVQ